MSATLAHEETVDLLNAADEGPLELVAFVEELVSAHRDDAVVMAVLAPSTPRLEDIEDRSC